MHYSTYNKKGWFHVTIRPSSDSSPEHVILVTSLISIVMRMSSFESGTERVSRETTRIVSDPQACQFHKWTITSNLESNFFGAVLAHWRMIRWI